MGTEEFRSEMMRKVLIAYLTNSGQDNLFIEPVDDDNMIQTVKRGKWVAVGWLSGIVREIENSVISDTIVVTICHR